MAVGTTAAIIIGAGLAAGAGAVQGNAQRQSNRRIANKNLANSKRLESQRRRTATSADIRKKELSAQTSKVSSAHDQKSQSLLLGTKGITKRGAPTSAGFSNITSNVLQEQKNV